MKKLTFLFIAGAFYFNLNAQTEIVIEEWVEKFSSPVPISQFATAIDVNGNVYITGFSLDPTEGQNFITIKYNTDGVQQWVQEHNSPFNSDDIPLAITINKNCDVYVCGYSVKDGTVGFELLTIKYDSLGNEIWTDRFNIGGLTAFLNPANIVLDNDENPIIIGALEGPTSDRDFVTIKYDPATGNRQWVAVFNGPGNRNDFGEVIAVDASNNVYVQGYSDQGGSQFNITSIKYNADGVQQWVASFNANNVGYFNPIGTGRLDSKTKSLSNDGGFYVTGNSNVGVTNIDFVTIKYDASTGNQLWSQTFDGPANGEDIPSGLVVDENSNVYVGGGSQGIGTGEDFTTIKYDPNGNLQWVAGYNGPIDALDRFIAMDIDNNSNIYVTGLSFIGIANTEIVTIKYDSDGNQQWLINYDSPDNVAGNQFEGATDLAVTNTGNVYVTGGSDGSQFSPGFLGFNFVTIKYRQVDEEILSILDSINKIPPLPLGKLEDLLLSASPLPDTVLIAMIKRKQMLPSRIVKDVLTANFPLSDKVMVVMLDKREPEIEGKTKRDILMANIPLSDNILVAIMLNKKLPDPFGPMSLQTQPDDLNGCTRHGELVDELGDFVCPPGHYCCLLRPSPCCWLIRNVLNDALIFSDTTDNVILFNDENAENGNKIINDKSEVAIIRGELLEEESVEVRVKNKTEMVIILSFRIDKVLKSSSRLEKILK